jgi:hypothetical protein
MSSNKGSYEKQIKNPLLAGFFMEARDRKKLGEKAIQSSSLNLGPIKFYSGFGRRSLIGYEI